MAKQKQTRRDVPSADHIARYCNHQRIIRDPITDEIRGVYPHAFALRERHKETYLSASWLEFFGANAGLDHQFKSALKALRGKHRGIKSDGAFVRLNAGRVIEVGAEPSGCVTALHEMTLATRALKTLRSTIPMTNSLLPLPMIAALKFAV